MTGAASVLSGAQARVLDALARAPAVRGWHLAGGTALALRHRHRVSEDFDLFRAEAFDPLVLARAVAADLPGLVVVSTAEGTLHASADGVRVSFLRFEPPLLEPPAPLEGLPAAGDLDIGAMKIAALGDRGARKDFVDLYLLAREGPGLEAVLSAFGRRFAGLRVETAHHLRSLAYFDDAEAEPMPRLLRPWTWEEIRTHFEGEVRRLSKVR